jgi:carbonic anhydrase
MSRILDDVLSANGAYAESFGARGSLALPPARGFTILTCMDARLDPARYAGLSEGDAHVIRNAGGRASDDAIRSLVISYKLLGTGEFFVIHHTDCGMQGGLKASSQHGLVPPSVGVRRELQQVSSSGVSCAAAC